MDMPWDDVRLFLAVVEAKSLSGAARLLGVGQPTMSRRIADLEERLGYELFRRAASGVALTPEAERLVAPARKMAEWAGEISRTAAQREGAPEGLVRITAPPGLAFDFLAPFAAWLREKHPEIRLQVLSSIAYVDLVRGDADLAIRMRGSTSPDLKVVTRIEHENAAFASRAYVSRLPRRYTFKDVAWIAWAPPFEQVPPNPQLEALIPDFQPVFQSDNFLVQLRAAYAGIGAMILGKMLHRFTRVSELAQLELDLGPYSRSSTYLVCPRTALDIPRIRLVAELLGAELEKAAT
jgi:DNA-binding transcriptional LysR family regulator